MDDAGGLGQGWEIATPAMRTVLVTHRDQRRPVLEHVVVDHSFWDLAIWDHGHEARISWCEANAGARKVDWCYHGAGRWSFADRGVAVAFRLAWCWGGGGT